MECLGVGVVEWHEIQPSSSFGPGDMVFIECRHMNRLKTIAHVVGMSDLNAFGLA
jgi:hypothetical protein